MGQQFTLMKEPSGVPVCRWAKTIPNQGLLYYTTALNSARVGVVSTKGIAEVLVTKTYDFEQPDQLRETIGHTVGLGLLFAEGDEHKVGRERNVDPGYHHTKSL